MYRLEQAAPTEEFKRAWSAAGQYIQNWTVFGNGLRFSIKIQLVL